MDIIVSVNCIVYNHEKYLRKCLDGLLKQKTNFDFEILVHDDRSTDSSRQIIVEYAKKYPEIIKPIFESSNQYSKGINISFSYQYPRAQGKYVAICEGDDFWNDPYKLQKQYDSLEKNKNCKLCVHRVVGVNENEIKNGVFYPSENIETGIIRQREFFKLLFIKDSYPFQTSSYFFEKKSIMEMKEKFQYIYDSNSSGDIKMLLYFGSIGDIYYINSPMSSYRMNSSGSWSSNINSNLKQKIKHQKNHITLLKSFDKYNGHKFCVYVWYDIFHRELQLLKEKIKLMKEAAK